MQYKIRIETVEAGEGERYPRTTTIYEQTLDDLDIENVIKAANNFEI